MPELPEVENVRLTLEPRLLHIPIAAIQVLRPDFLTPQNAPIQNLLHHHITHTLRHGKKLFLVADDLQTLVIHLGMSGRIDCTPASAPIPIHTHFILELTTLGVPCPAGKRPRWACVAEGTPEKSATHSNTHVRLRDPRRFGGLWYYPNLALAQSKETANLGIDALALTPSHLAHWPNSKARLKQRLLSQKDFAGLGNIYIDEALWLARLHPRQRLDRIPPAQRAALVKAIRKILNRSIRLGGTTLRDYRNVSDQPGRFAQRLLAYGRAGKPCTRCDTILNSTQVAARTTVFCPHCQKLR